MPLKTHWSLGKCPGFEGLRARPQDREQVSVFPVVLASSVWSLCSGPPPPPPADGSQVVPLLASSMLPLRGAPGAPSSLELTPHQESGRREMLEWSVSLTILKTPAALTSAGLGASVFESVRACACLCLRVRRWPVPGALYLVACAWWRSEGRRV